MKYKLLTALFLLIAISLCGNTSAVDTLYGTNITLSIANETVAYGNYTVTMTPSVGATSGTGNASLYYSNDSDPAWILIGHSTELANESYSFTWNTNSWNDADNYTLNVTVYNETNANLILSRIAYEIRVDSTVPNITDTSFTSPTEKSTEKVTLTINESSTCKWDFVDVAYANMRETFDSTSTSPSTNVKGMDSSKTYSVYVRCQDAYSNLDTTSTVLSIVRQTAYTEETTPEILEEEKKMTAFWWIAIIIGIVVLLLIVVIVTGKDK